MYSMPRLTIDDYVNFNNAVQNTPGRVLYGIVRDARVLEIHSYFSTMFLLSPTFIF